MSEKAGPLRMQEITVDGDLYTTLGLAVLFILSAVLLLRDLHQVFWGQHLAAAIGSAISQVALLIFCVTVVQWFKSVIRWSSESEPARS